MATRSSPPPVEHVAYLAGQMVAGETRPFCVSYGQWRTWYVDTTGEADAILLLQLSRSISSLYVRAFDPPTRTTLTAAGSYDVLAASHQQTVTASPCDVTSPTRWYFSSFLETEFYANGLTPGVLDVNLTLRDASLQLNEPVQPRRLGGRGFACCG